jgi:hypothetical protein
MGRTARKLNFMVDEEICRDLKALVPLGNRSRVVNEALRKELESIRRTLAAEGLMSSANKGKRFSNAEIVMALTRDRGGH